MAEPVGAKPVMVPAGATARPAAVAAGRFRARPGREDRPL